MQGELLLLVRKLYLISLVASKDLFHYFISFVLSSQFVTEIYEGASFFNHFINFLSLFLLLQLTTKNNINQYQKPGETRKVKLKKPK